MVDRVLLRPFNSSGTTRSPRPGGRTRSPWLPSAEKGAYCFTHAGAKKLMMTYFTLFLHINYPINISITSPVKAEDSTSQWLTERTGFGPSHKSHRVHLVSDSLFLSLCLWFIICNPAHRMDCVWWTEDALEGNEMIPQLKWMGLINTTRRHRVQGEGLCQICTMKADRCTYVKVIYREKGTWSDEIALEVRQNVMIGINIQDKELREVAVWRKY